MQKKMAKYSQYVDHRSKKHIPRIESTNFDQWFQKSIEVLTTRLLK